MSHFDGYIMHILYDDGMNNDSHVSFGDKQTKK